MDLALVDIGSLTNSAFMERGVLCPGDLENNEPFMPSREFLRKTRDKLKSHGIVFQVLPWKCADPRAYTRLLELGVESFATDYPEMTREVVHPYQKGPSQK